MNYPHGHDIIKGILQEGCGNSSQNQTENGVVVKKKAEGQRDI